MAFPAPKNIGRDEKSSVFNGKDVAAVNAITMLPRPRGRPRKNQDKLPEMLMKKNRSPTKKTLIEQFPFLMSSSSPDASVDEEEDRFSTYRKKERKRRRPLSPIPRSTGTRVRIPAKHVPLSLDRHVALEHLHHAMEAIRRSMRVLEQLKMDEPSCSS